MKKLSLIFFLLALFSFIPKADAAMYSSFEISGWIPYWRTATGTAEMLTHMSDFKEINPFGYTVKSDGSLYDAAGLASTNDWLTLKYLAKQKQIRFIPTIMWSDGKAIDKVLRNPTSRQKHINAIVAQVNSNNFDGIDIDYEAKLAETSPYFSAFIKGLSINLGRTGKWLQCTIEARTPIEARTGSTTAAATYAPAYANDYKVLNQYCDRVRIMAYDQASIDKQLSSISQGPYVPVSDPKWAEKVISLAIKSISRKKIMLGVATYGYEYEVKPLLSGYTYKNLWAFNPKYATDLAAELNITPTRNSAGELSFSYTPTTTSATISAAGATTHILWWSDAQAIKDKIDLAKRYGLRGVSIFKIDGGADPSLWNILDAYRN